MRLNVYSSVVHNDTVYSCVCQVYFFIIFSFGVLSVLHCQPPRFLYNTLNASRLHSKHHCFSGSMRGVQSLFSRRVFFRTHFSKIRSYRKICKYTFIRMQIYILITKKTQSNIRTAFSLFFICRLLLFAGNSFSARLQFSWAAASYCSSIRVFSIIYRGRRFVSRYILPIYSPIIPIAKSCKPPSAHTDTISEVQPLTVLPVKWRMSE